MFGINPFGGFRVIASEHMVDKYQAKTHPRKRINKKWLKRYGYIIEPKKEAIVMNGNTIVAHPSLVAKIEAELARQNQR